MAESNLNRIVTTIHHQQLACRMQTTTPTPSITVIPLYGTSLSSADVAKRYSVLQQQLKLHMSSLRKENRMSALSLVTSSIARTLVTSLLAGVLFASCMASVVYAAEQSISGRVVSVTVYRDQARVIRDIKIPASDQPQQIRITGLPPQLIQQSWFTESDEGTNVRSLQVTLPKAKNEAADDEKNEALRKLHAAEKAAEHDLKVIEQDMLTLEQLVAFSADKVHQNLDRGRWMFSPSLPWPTLRWSDEEDWPKDCTPNEPRLKRSTIKLPNT